MKATLIFALLMLSAISSIQSKIASGTYALFNIGNGFSLDIAYQSTADKANLIGYKYWGGKNQQYDFQSTGNGDYFIIRALNSGKALTSTSKGNTDIVQTTPNGKANQEWKITRVSRGRYAIQSRSSGKYLTFANTNGAHIVQKAKTGKADQLFNFLYIHTNNRVLSGNYAIITNVRGRAFDIAYQSKDDNANLISWQYWAGNNQKFTIKAVDSTYVTLTGVQSQKAITVPVSSTDAGTEIVQLAYTGDCSQHWQLTQRKDGSYRIISKISGLVLQVSNTQGGKITQETRERNPNQSFWIMAV